MGGGRNAAHGHLRLFWRSWIMRKTLVAAGLTLALCGAAFADTPIGPGVTGSGGTGLDSADTTLKPGAGGEARVLRQDGTPADQADRNLRSESSGKAASRGELKPDAAAPVGVGASGTVGGAGKAAGSLPEGTRNAPPK
jgi:hypothetical protein